MGFSGSYIATPALIVAILIDIEHFKTVNDRYGHLAGDAVIAEVGRVIRRSVRNSDLVFRWGGEEYLVIAKNRLANEGQALAEKIRSAVSAAPLGQQGEDVSATISAGVAMYEPEKPIDDWIARADRALYISKDQGRNVVRMSG
jgi:diguanylate cyclase (GGDEF)-like protein